MKKHFIRIVLSSLLIMGSNMSFGQLVSVDSMKVIPDPATANDVVNVIIYTTFTSGNCELTSESVDIQGSSIQVTLDYTVGSATYICHSIDTISLGTLEEGNYTLTATVSENNEPSSEVNATTYFSVTGSLGISQPVNLSAAIRIYPNPFEDELAIFTSDAYHAALYNLQVQAITIQQNTTESGIALQVSGCEKGVYLLVLTDESGNKYTKKIVKK